MKIFLFIAIFVLLLSFGECQAATDVVDLSESSSSTTASQKVGTTTSNSTSDEEEDDDKWPSLGIVAALKTMLRKCLQIKQKMIEKIPDLF